MNKVNNSDDNNNNNNYDEALSGKMINHKCLGES